MKLLRIFFILVSLPFLQAKTIVCSFSILKDLCTQLCQGIDTIDVHTIVPNSVDPHLYQPKPSDSKTLAKANLVITNGLNLEGWVQNLIDGSGYKGTIIVASSNVQARYLGKLPDPHIWHSPVLIILMIDNITHGLKEAFPEYTSAFEKNATSLKATFKELQANVSALLSTIEQAKRVMLTTHDAFSYFAQCYNVKVLSPQGVSTSDDPSAADMKNLINQIRDLDISAIFLENLSNPKILKVIALETGKKVKGVLYADTLKDDLSLQDTLWYNAVIIAEANQEELMPEELQALINNRLWAVTDKLSMVSRHNPDETLFDLMMLVFDSLTEKREIILNLWDSSSLNPGLICEGQSQIITAIDGWHQELNLHWNTARYVQNLLFLCALIYAAVVWKDDTSADNSKVMAKIDELIGWLNASKSAPFDLIEKIKNTIMG